MKADKRYEIKLQVEPSYERIIRLAIPLSSKTKPAVDDRGVAFESEIPDAKSNEDYSGNGTGRYVNVPAHWKRGGFMAGDSRSMGNSQHLYSPPEQIGRFIGQSKIMSPVGYPFRKFQSNYLSNRGYGMTSLLGGLMGAVPGALGGLAYSALRRDPNWLTNAGIGAGVGFAAGAGVSALGKHKSASLPPDLARLLQNSGLSSSQIRELSQWLASLPRQVASELIRSVLPLGGAAAGLALYRKFVKNRSMVGHVLSAAAGGFVGSAFASGMRGGNQFQQNYRKQDHFGRPRNF
jgi:hypothetical protein